MVGGIGYLGAGGMIVRVTRLAGQGQAACAEALYVYGIQFFARRQLHFRLRLFVLQAFHVFDATGSGGLLPAFKRLGFIVAAKYQAISLYVYAQVLTGQKTVVLQPAATEAELGVRHIDFVGPRKTLAADTDAPHGLLFGM